METFDPKALCSDVKEISSVVIGLAGSLKDALVKFQSVDARLDEFQSIQAGMQEYLSIAQQPVGSKAHAKGTAVAGASKSKGIASDAKGSTQCKGAKLGSQLKGKGTVISAAGIKSKRTATAAGNNKRKKTKAATEIMQNDILNIDFDGAHLEIDEGASAGIQTQESEVVATAETPKNPPFLTPWLQKSFRSATSVEVTFNFGLPTAELIIFSLYLTS